MANAMLLAAAMEQSCDRPLRSPRKMNIKFGEGAMREVELSTADFEFPPANPLLESFPSFSPREDKKLHRCTVCEFSTPHKSSYQRHQLVHEGVTKLHSCKHCSFTSTRTDHLRRHERLHLGDGAKNFQCQKCSFKSYRKDRLTEHLKKCGLKRAPVSKPVKGVGHGVLEKSDTILVCSMCDYSTPYKHVFKKHQQLHGVEVVLPASPEKTPKKASLTPSGKKRGRPRKADVLARKMAEEAAKAEQQAMPSANMAHSIAAVSQIEDNNRQKQDRGMYYPNLHQETQATGGNMGQGMEDNYRVVDMFGDLFEKYMNSHQTSTGDSMANGVKTELSSGAAGMPQLTFAGEGAVNGIKSEPISGAGMRMVTIPQDGVPNLIKTEQSSEAGTGVQTFHHDLMPNVLKTEPSSGGGMQLPLVLNASDYNENFKNTGPPSQQSEHHSQVTDRMPQLQKFEYLSSLPSHVKSEIESLEVDSDSQSSFQETGSSTGGSSSQRRRKAKPRKVIQAEPESLDVGKSVKELLSSGKLTQCIYCNIFFGDSRLYNCHMELHSPDNPWSCHLCGVECGDKYDFASHCCVV